MTDTGIIVAAITTSGLVISGMLALLLTKKTRANQANIDRAKELEAREKGYIQSLEKLVEDLKAEIRELKDSNINLKLYLKQCREERQQLMEDLIEERRKNGRQ